MIFRSDRRGIPRTFAELRQAATAAARRIRARPVYSLTMIAFTLAGYWLGLYIAGQWLSDLGPLIARAAGCQD